MCGMIHVKVRQIKLCGDDRRGDRAVRFFDTSIQHIMRIIF
jgi:hypothetical protein